jgi:uncharacterized protein (TIGR00251 family)
LKVEDGPAGALLAVRVIPRAGRDAIAGTRQDALLVRLAAPPVDGAANDALIGLLAELLVVPRRAVSVVTGARSRDKRVRIAGLAAADVRRRLSAILSR